MRWTTSLLLTAFAGAAGCGEVPRDLRDADAEETGTAIPDEPPARACDYCVDTAPATFSGPSNFWRGRADLAPPCSEPTPLPGIEGYLTEPTADVQFVRECRFTPSDTCNTEGKVCAPLPDEGFSTCIHHLGPGECPADYDDRQEEIQVTEGKSLFTFKLCCLASPVPG
jgi:hypothetical protein